MERLFYIDGRTVSARTPEAAFGKLGLEMPADLYPFTGFAVRCWLWSERDDDYAVEDLTAEGLKVFADWNDALDCFRKLGEKDLRNGEMKVDLAQFSLGRCRVQLSRIILSEAKPVG